MHQMGAFVVVGSGPQPHIEVVPIVQIVLTNGMDKENDDANAVNLFVP